MRSMLQLGLTVGLGGFTVSRFPVIFCLLLLTQSVWATDSVLRVQSYVISENDPSLHLDRTYMKNGTFYTEGIDVLMEYRVCPSYHESYCIFQANRNLIFSIPKVADSVKDGWEFGGFKFKVKNVSESQETVVIHGYPSDAFQESISESGYEIKVYVFLYSWEVGLTSFSRKIKLPDGDVQTSVWVFSNPVDFQALNEKLDEYAKLTQSELKLLEGGEFNLPLR